MNLTGEKTMSETLIALEARHSEAQRSEYHNHTPISEGGPSYPCPICRRVKELEFEIYEFKRRTESDLLEMLIRARGFIPKNQESLRDEINSVIAKAEGRL